MWSIAEGSSISNPEAVTLALPPQHDRNASPSSSSAFSLVVAFVRMNVLTLDIHASSQRAPEGQQTGFNVTARMGCFASRPSRHQVFACGVQEGRDTTDRELIVGDYLVYTAARDERHQLGVQLWISQTVPCAHTDGSDLFVKAQHVVVLFRSPSIIVVSITAAQFSATCCSAHAPTSAAEDSVIHQRWSTLRSTILQFLKLSELFVLMIDSNGRLGSNTSMSVGDVNHQVENLNGSEMHDTFIALGVFAPSTFQHDREGFKHTWESPDGTVRNRIDYVCFPLQTRPYVLHTFMIFDFYFGSVSRDHVWPAAVFDGRHQANLTMASRRARPNRRLLNDPEARDNFTQTLQEIQRPL